MTPGEWAALAGGIGGPLSGIVIALITYSRSRRENDATTTVAQQAVHVDEKQAHTAELAMIIDGFTESLAAVRSELADTRVELKETRADYDALRDEHNTLKSRVDRDAAQRAEMIQHITALEALIPNPPGPPERPEWN